MSRNELEYYIKLFRKNVFAAALCYVRNPSDADDIAQEVFIRLYTYSGHFNSDEHVKAWLIRCAVNMSKNLLRSHWYRFSAPLDDAADAAYYDRTENGTGMLQIMKKLGRNNRIALYMYYYEGYTTDEISQILGVSPNTVSSRIRRGRQQLKKLLETERNDPDELQRFF